MNVQCNVQKSNFDKESITDGVVEFMLQLPDFPS